MSAERDKIIAYLKGMAAMSFKHKGMVGAVIAQALDAAGDQIHLGAHEDADTVFPEHMPPRYTVTVAKA